MGEPAPVDAPEKTNAVVEEGACRRAVENIASNSGAVNLQWQYDNEVYGRRLGDKESRATTPSMITPEEAHARNQQTILEMEEHAKAYVGKLPTLDDVRSIQAAIRNHPVASTGKIRDYAPRSDFCNGRGACTFMEGTIKRDFNPAGFVNVWVYGRIPGSIEGKHFNWHVAPAILARSGDTTAWYVIDDVYNSEPVKLGDYYANLKSSGEDTNGLMRLYPTQGPRYLVSNGGLQFMEGSAAYFYQKYQNDPDLKEEDRNALLKDTVGTLQFWRDLFGYYRPYVTPEKQEIWNQLQPESDAPAPF